MECSIEIHNIINQNILKMFFPFLVLALLFAIVSGSSMDECPRLSYSDALKIIEKCHDRAKSLNLKVTVAVTDVGGSLIGLVSEI